MIPALFRSAVSATATSTATRAAASRIIRRPRMPHRIRTPRQVQSRVIRQTPATPKIPTIPSKRFPLAPAERGVADYSHPGNLQPIDTNAKTDYGNYPKPVATSPDNTLTPPTPVEREGNADIVARLMATGTALQSQLSSFIPSIQWTGGVSARGFKSTPLRRVLHYCLAVVFGTTHQARIGHTIIKVDLYPNENKVEVVYNNSSSLIFEPMNIALNALANAQQVAGIDPVEFAKRPFGESVKVIARVAKFAGKNANPKEGVKTIVKNVGDLARRLGVGGIWDMAQSNIYAGRPPATMILGAINAGQNFGNFGDVVQPFGEIYKTSVIEKNPMLTRQLALNPQAPKIPTMHYPTHFDLRSLVAQALYDPGVMPPIPDTNVALPQVDLP